MNPSVKRDRLRGFYATMGLVMAAVVLVGFSRTYYLKAWFDTPPLTLRLHLHGLLLTLWLVIFVVQARLAATGRLALHRTLGVAGVAVAGLAVAVTWSAAVEAAQLGGDRGGITAADRLYSSILVASLFGLFVAMGATFRGRREIHKRLMLLATIAVIGPAVTRAVALLAGSGVRDSHIAVECALVLLAMLNDWHARGRPHWVLLCGGLLLIGSQLTRRLVGGSETWDQIGNWLIQ